MAKQRSDTGSVKKMPNGKWKATVTVGYDPETGNQVRKSKTFQLKKDALDFMDYTIKKYRDIDLSTTDMSFKELCDRWETVKRKEVKTSTWGKYKNSMRILLVTLENRTVESLRYGDFQEILNDMANEGRVGNYINTVKQVANYIMEYATLNNVIVVNPVAKTKTPRTKEGEPKRVIDAFTDEEIATIESHYKNINFGDMVYLLIKTGLRGQELCALDNSAVTYDKDKDQYYLSVHQAMCRDFNSWNLDTTKTATANREIPITSELSSIIKARLMQSTFDGERRPMLPGATKDGFISYGYFQKCYINFFKQLNARLALKEQKEIRILSPHCCRHTYATTLVKKGIPSHIAMYLLGHSNYATTMNIYTEINKTDSIDDLKKAGII